MRVLFRFIVFFLFVNSISVTAQDTLVKAQSSNFYDMSLEELMSIKISVASVKEMTSRESPGIVTLITEDEIKNSGARDLMDILRFIPGFDFGMDVEGVIGIGVRGNWAHEGKILLLIDGQEMNENLYSSIQMGNHYPVEEIEKIEIIRGPGSAIYGGYAEYAVINVITKKGTAYQGIHYSGSYGQMSKTFGNRNFNMAAGDEGKAYSYSFNASINQSNRSQDNYRDVFRSRYNMADQSEMRNTYVNVGLNFRDYLFRGIIDNYNLMTRDAYQEIMSRAYLVEFNSYFFELKKDFKLNHKLSLTPKFNYKNQTPWSFNQPAIDDEFEKFKVTSKRYSVNITANYDVTPNINFISGAEYFKDIALQKTDALFYTNNSERFDYENFAFFSQALFRSNIANITAGARYNLSSHYDASFVPRLGVTKTINKLHLKVLFSKAFRAPNTQNIDLQPSIKPEKTSVFEMEAGYEINEKMLLTFNAFDITTFDPIVYYYDDANDGDSYANFDKTGTKGFEVEYKYKTKKGYAGLNYSFYSTQGKEVLSNYSVPFNHHVLLAFPAHKINLTSGFKINDHIKINSCISFSGPRYGIVNLKQNGDTLYKKFTPYIIANLNISYDNLLVKGLHVSAGVFNVLDSKDVYIQPYNSLHAPLPANSRTFIIKISYNLKFKE